MKIAILADNFPAPGRPRYVFVQQIVFALVDMGHQVSVIAPQSITHAWLRGEKLLPTHSVEKTMQSNTFDVYRPYDITFGNGHRWLYRLVKPFCERGINRSLSKIKPDILYGHFWHSAYKLKNFALKYKIPLFVACGEGDDAMEYLESTLSQGEKKQFVDLVKGVICVSSENQRLSVQLGLIERDKTIVLPNSVDTQQFRPYIEKDLYRKLHIEEDDFVVLFVGGFIKRKGPDKLVAAVESLNDKHIKLIFIGKPKGGDVVDPVSDQIVFKSSCDHEMLPPFYNIADVFVLPTLREGCSNAIIEALSCGVPVVSSDRSFNHDILHDENSILVDPESVEEIANAIFTLKNDRKLYNEKKTYVMAHCGQYNIKERARRIMEFIDKMLADK